MAERIIDLDYNTYQNLVKMIQGNQKNIYFRNGNDMISIPNKSKNKSCSEQNIVERWMNDITKLADDGLNQNGCEVKQYFNAIRTYCRAVIISVTS